MSAVTNESLKNHGWSDLALRAYQLDGVNWLLKCYSHKHGCILGDEMGLGKTCQTIAMLAWLTNTSGDKRPHLVVCPRSVLENWAEEFKRFSPDLKVISYVGDKETRAELGNKIKKSKQGMAYCFDVLITTYEVCLKDFLFLHSLSWHVLVVDEAHRLKNCESLLYQTLEKWDFQCGVLLTGTPVQNNLQELFSLLAFIDRCKFKPRHVDRFVEKYSHEHGDEIEELHELLKPYLLRRKKETVLKDLPERSDVVLYHGLSALQKKLYKAILTKDLDAFENPNTGQVHLMNILMQLRKCVNHPYLFDGVEPEPFELGEHLVEASAKLMLIDRLLKWLNALGHKVLIFSQMTHMLDVLQDYLGYRGFTYERLDGSVRGEERFLAVQNFNQNDETFVFLLSTKAGGQGLNLTAADTVIFVDSDFNPQNDLQAASRAHRIGQNRPVRVIRLIGKNTVEEIILTRAEEKLKLTDKVIESGEFSAAGMSVSKPAFVKNSKQLQDILKFGVEKLLSDDTPDEDIEFSRILGPTVNGEWQTTEDTSIIQDAEEEKSSKEEAPKNMYMFEGHDYSKETSAGDREAFDALIKLEKTSQRESSSSERLLRRKGTAFLADLLPELSRKPRKQLTLEEQEIRREKHKEAAEKRAQKLAEQKEKKREELWKKHKYTSVNIMIESEDEFEEEEEAAEEEESEENVDQPRRSIHYVMGDVTHPLDAGTSGRIVVHCADDSGYWGRGGLFSAISARSPKPQAQYELAGKVNDLKLGDCHLISLDDDKEKEDGQDMLALIVAQTRDRNNRLSGIKLMALKEGLEKVYFRAKQLKASVHLPRIGHDTPGFNWYGTERLIHKILASKGVPTYIYYFPRRQNLKHKGVGFLPQPPAKASYQKGVSLLQKAEEKSDISSSCLSDASHCGIQKRKLVPRRIWSPSYENSNSTSPSPTCTSSLPNVSCTITKYRKRARSRSPSNLPVVLPAPPRSVGSVIPRTLSPVRRAWSVQSPAQPGPFTAIDRASITQSELKPEASSAGAPDWAIPASLASSAPTTSASDWSSIASIVQMLPSYFEKSFKKMEETRTAVEILQRKVDQLEAMQKHSNVAASQTTPALPDGFILPLQEVDQLERLNDSLAEEVTRQRMVLYLSYFGGSTPKEALYRLLKHLLVPKLSILYSLEGRKGKRRFNSLQYLKAVIYEPLLKKYNNVTMANLDKYTGEWLAISGDRDGGRKRREEKKLQIAKVVEGRVKNRNSEADPNIQVQKATGSVNSGSSTSSMAPSTLPELFKGVAIHLYNMDQETMTKYKRYIIAYDGDVDAYVHSSTTHLVANAETDKEALKKIQGDHKCYIVSSQWLDDCLKRHKLLSPDDYVLEK